MTVIAAVSGGVDSVAMLHMLVQEAKDEIIVAHFDHGIRPESDADARFVKSLAEQYGVVYEIKREELGATASEALARDRRYSFLHSIASKYNGVITTAHHADDVVETIAINVTRGTGWRGLACLNSDVINRPLLEIQKQDIYEYALTHELEWVEDETNATDAYLRNSIRRRMALLNDQSRAKLLDLRERQVDLKAEIDIEAKQFSQNSGIHLRYFYIAQEQHSAIELLRAILLQQNASLTRPQRLRLLHAIKTAQPGAVIQLGGGIAAAFTARDFTIKTP